MMLCPACNSRYEGEVSFCPRDGTPVAREETGDELIGKVLDDRYRIVRRIGIGGMGEVFEARHVYIEKRSALKLLRKEIMSNVEAVTRFHKEARAASAIGHENIVEIEDFGRLDDGRVYLTMEYLEGQSLADAARTPLPFSRALDIIRQVGHGLTAAHAKGIIHRDLKPENIFLTQKEGREVVKILDFGIAKVASGGVGTGPSNLTRTGVIFGTPHYMSPEQAQGGAIDLRSDIYSLGIILYELLVGQVPFRGDSFMAILMRHITEPPRPPRMAAPDRQIPEPLERIALRAIAKSPTDRYPSVAALLEDLGQIGADGNEVGPLLLDKPKKPDTRPSGNALADDSLLMTGREMIGPLPSNRRPALVILGIAAAIALLVGIKVARNRSSASSASSSGPVLSGGEKVAAVLLDTEPSGAAIIRDGRYFSETPEQIEIPPGTTLTVGLHRDGYRDTTATLDPAQKRKMMVKLERAVVGEEHRHAVMPPPKRRVAPAAVSDASAPPAEIPPLPPVPEQPAPAPRIELPAPGSRPTGRHRRNRAADEPINPY